MLPSNHSYFLLLTSYFSKEEPPIFNDILLITDADWTLLTDDKRVAPRDMSAINELREGGGLFTIATGRGVAYTRPLAEMLHLDMPVVIFNGAAVYDFKSERFLWCLELPSDTRKWIELFLERFPTLGIEIQRGYEVNVISTNRLEEEHIALGSLGPGNLLRRPLAEVPNENWVKALIVDEPETIDEVVAFAATLDLSGIYTVRSGDAYFEILPEGANKGRGLEKLIELMGLRQRSDGGTLRVVAAGDYMNDIEMLKAADVAVAVANAEDAVKEHADLIVCDNNSGPIFEIVERLKIMYNV
jgi:Cof subfamily protein (haloacid dehalogenase superfamily)